MSCAVYNCKSGSHAFDRKIKLFSFPQDPEIKRKWLVACRRTEGELKVEKAQVCELHFGPGYIENRVTRKTTKNVTPRMMKRLVKGSIPTLHLDLEKRIQKKTFNFWTQCQPSTSEPNPKMP
ncbi:PREDICTED: uncharacterized protein LOC108782059 [Cyphomyrmex costatus]|uniref:uncharacterized protein LOC108782059 n=1 Tax=Cyphomyrmex costatus TaxID=456900 RepID=UPI0008523F94|nr:PREDICTED: uncharacterized protein LOC108782059 [Cyphomyrmex costatus]